MHLAASEILSTMQGTSNAAGLEEILHRPQVLPQESQPAESSQGDTEQGTDVNMQAEIVHEEDDLALPSSTAKELGLHAPPARQRGIAKEVCYSLSTL